MLSEVDPSNGAKRPGTRLAEVWNGDPAMLVLSRQKNQRINFPGLGISVEILDVKGSRVRVGVEAPIEVRVLRDEIADFEEPKPYIAQLPQNLRHDLRNALHELSLMLHVYQKKAEIAGANLSIDASEMFEAIIHRIENLNQHALMSSPGVVSPDAGSSNISRGDALVVDDDANERELLAGFLRMCDYRVSTAADGIEALRFLKHNELPKVILLDMTMPRCDGQAFLRQVREIESWDPVHVFVVSGKSPAECGSAPRDGYTHWFQKPLDPRRIVEELASLERPTTSFA